MDCSGAIRFATDLLMSPEQCVHIGWDAELVSSLLEFIERLRDIHVDVIEFCFLNAIVLTYPGLVCVPYFAGSLEVGLSIYVHIVYFFMCSLSLGNREDAVDCSRWLQANKDWIMIWMVGG